MENGQHSRKPPPPSNIAKSKSPEQAELDKFIAEVDDRKSQLDVERAKQVFEQALQFAEGDESTLHNIAAELAKVDVERAITIADEIGVLSYKVDALIGIASVLLDGEAVAHQP